MSLVEFLVGLSQPAGIAGAVAVLISLILEVWPGYKSKSTAYKQTTVGVLCMLMAIFGVFGAYVAGCIMEVNGTVCLQLTDVNGVWFPAIAAGFGAFGVTTATHRGVEAAKGAVKSISTMLIR